MDPFLVVALLRAAGTLFTLQGKPQVGLAFNAAGAAFQAGRNVDAHMQEIADALQSGAEPTSWIDIAKRVNDETSAFLDQPPKPV